MNTSFKGVHSAVYMIMPTGVPSALTLVIFTVRSTYLEPKTTYTTRHSGPVNKKDKNVKYARVLHVKCHTAAAAPVVAGEKNNIPINKVSIGPSPGKFNNNNHYCIQRGIVCVLLSCAAFEEKRNTFRGVAFGVGQQTHSG